jgi:hypothetical protein
VIAGTVVFRPLGVPSPAAPSVTALFPRLDSEPGIVGSALQMCRMFPLEIMYPMAASNAASAILAIQRS